tara:strand:- start:880 stop:1161 length:282 start_codon:yes stop_codon:yes gene_type:complete
MKLTKTRLKEIIKEEVVNILEGKKYKRDTDVSGVKVEEEQELDEISTMGGGAVAGYSGPVKKEDKLSPKQSKEMDTDKDGDIDAKDLKALRHS